MKDRIYNSSWTCYRVAIEYNVQIRFATFRTRSRKVLKCCLMFCFSYHINPNLVPLKIILAINYPGVG